MPNGLLNGAILLGAIALAWVIERPKKPAPPVMDTYPAGWTVDPEAVSAGAGILRMRWPWWRAVLLETYDAMSKDRLLAVAAGVVFYALLAIFPAITAFVSSYGLFANAGAIQDDLSMLANVLPAGGISIIAGADRSHRRAAERAQRRVRRGPPGGAVERQRRRQGDDRCAQRHRGAGRAPHLRAAQCCCRSR